MFNRGVSEVSVTLGDLINNDIAFMCICTHSATFSVKDLLEVYPPETSYDDIRRNARCTMCGRKGYTELRIIYVGGSMSAMAGGNQKKTD